MTKQKSLIPWGMEVAEVIGSRSSCSRGNVGCVLMNKAGKIIATGYNSPPSGLPHCIDNPCLGANKRVHPDSCISVHAEVSAIAQCRDTAQVDIAIVTLAPCFRCSKVLLNTGMTKLVYKGNMLPECTKLFIYKNIKLINLDNYNGT
jgi:dCMP deaminase